MPGNRVEDAAETAVCARLGATNLSVAPPQQREIAKTLRFERGLEHVLLPMFD